MCRQWQSLEQHNRRHGDESGFVKREKTFQSFESRCSIVESIQYMSMKLIHAPTKEKIDSLVDHYGSPENQTQTVSAATTDESEKSEKSDKNDKVIIDESYIKWDRLTVQEINHFKSIYRI